MYGDLACDKGEIVLIVFVCCKELSSGYLNASKDFRLLISFTGLFF
jgi:hypothetical protein